MPLCRLSILIPVFNEADTVLPLFAAVDALSATDFEKEIIVVDDGSTDGTADKIRNFVATRPLWKTATHAINRGKGAAVCTALALATGDAVIVQDADMEYNPEDIKRMAAVFTGANAVFGSRNLQKNHYSYRSYYLGGYIMTKIFSLLYGCRMTDMLTCYKLMATDTMRQMQLQSRGFAIEAEMSAKLARCCVSVNEVPISYHSRTKEQGKKIRPRDALTILMTLIRYRFWKK